MSINLKQQRVRVGKGTGGFGGVTPKIGRADNTDKAPSVLKRHKFPKIRGVNGKR